MAMTKERILQFIREVEEKIEILLDQFAGGSISREHFDVIYARYSRQLSIAEQSLETGNLDSAERVMNELSTLAVHAAVRGKALGMAVVHHQAMDILRTFGNYELEPARYEAIVTQIRKRLAVDDIDYTHVENLFGSTWLIVCSLEHSTLITLYRNEPAAKQVQELERRHHDFESANRNILNQSNPDPETLVYPVQLFVSK